MSIDFTILSSEGYFGNLVIREKNILVILVISLPPHEIEEYANLMDKNHNSFEMKVDRMAGCIVLTTGCGALRDFYNINTGVWITLVYMGLRNFGIKKIRSKTKNMVIPVYDPPMRFEIDRNVNHGALFHELRELVRQLSYRHNSNNFSIYYERLLRHVDINSGFLVRGYIDISLRYNTTCFCRICLTNNFISSY